MPETFTPVIRRIALAQHVLVVAQTQIEGAWCAFCDAVPGHDHEAEHVEVLRFGDAMPEAVARVMFPEFADLPYAP